jgi:hypothetical protein
MKTTKLALSLITIAHLATGCATTQTPTTTAIEQGLVTGGVAAGTAAILKNNPKYTPDFQIGAAFLNQVAGSTNTVTPAEVEAALAANNVTNPIVSGIITAGITTGQGFLAGFETNTSATSTDIKLISGWVGTGILQGIAIDAPVVNSVPLQFHKP